MDTATYIRYVRRDETVDHYIQLGVVYALKCVLKYWDTYRRQNKFGPLLDLDDLQEEMMETLTRVAQYFSKLPPERQVNDQGENTFQFYLGKAIRLHLWHLSRRMHGDVYLQSLDELLDNIDPWAIDYGQSMSVALQATLQDFRDREKLTVEDVALQTESTSITDDFLRHLTDRQRTILLYRHDYPDASDREVAEALGLSQPTVWREMANIKFQINWYAGEYMPEWLSQIKRREHGNKKANP